MQLLSLGWELLSTWKTATVSEAKNVYTDRFREFYLHG